MTPNELAAKITALVARKDWEELLACSREAMRRYPEWSEGWFWAAWASAKLGALDDALVFAGGAIQVAPSDANNRQLLASVHMQRGEPVEALSAARLAVAIDPTYQSLLSLCVAADAVGDGSTALQAAEQLLARRPGDAKATALAYKWRQGETREPDPDDAIRAMLAELAKDHDGDLLFRLGARLAQLERFMDAVVCLAWAIRLQPDNHTNWLHLGHALHRLSEHERGAAALAIAAERLPYTDAGERLAFLVDQGVVPYPAARLEEEIRAGRVVLDHPPNPVLWRASLETWVRHASPGHQLVQTANGQVSVVRGRRLYATFLIPQVEAVFGPWTEIRGAYIPAMLAAWPEFLLQQGKPVPPAADKVASSSTSWVEHDYEFAASARVYAFGGETSE